MAKDFDGKLKRNFWMAAGDRSGRGGDCVHLWISPLLFVDLPDLCVFVASTVLLNSIAGRE